jgi:hypothetical protein
MAQASSIPSTRAEGGTGAGELAIGSRDHHVAERLHGPGEDVQADRIDAVVVGQENAHGTIISHRRTRIRITPSKPG